MGGAGFCIDDYSIHDALVGFFKYLPCMKHALYLQFNSLDENCYDISNIFHHDGVRHAT